MTSPLSLITTAPTTSAVELPTLRNRATSENTDQQIAFPKLTEAEIARLLPFGETRPTQPGDLLFQVGDTHYDFFVLLEGEVEIVEPTIDDERLIARHGPGGFLGEVNMFTGQTVFLNARITQPGAVLQIKADKLREIISTVPEMSDRIVNAFLMRRLLLMEGAAEGIRIIGSRYSRDALRLRQFVGRNQLPHTFIDLEVDEQAERLLRELGVRPDQTPIVINVTGEILRNPSNMELGRLLGLEVQVAPDQLFDLIVIGAGPAGLAASVYGASEGLKTLALEVTGLGGQAGTSSKIENYLGFPSGLSGAELASRASIQAQKFGTQIAVPREANALRQENGHYVVETTDGDHFSTGSVIIATGAQYRRLDVPDLERFEGAGVYYAATEMEAQICGDQTVIIVGGGNSAGQAAMFLSERAKQVYHVIRGDDLGKSMSRYLVRRIESSPTIKVLHNTEVVALGGNTHLRRVTVRSRATGDQEELDAQGLFVFIGADPCTRWLEGALALDEHGFILTGNDLDKGTLNRPVWRAVQRPPYYLETSLPGVFAVGDVRSNSVKRVASAVGEGSIAVRFVHEYLSAGE